MRKQLTALMIEREMPPAMGRREIFDTIVPALALRLTSNGARSFVVRGRIKGQRVPVRLTLGDATAMKLADARNAASDVLRAMRAGTDPREAKKVAKRAQAPVLTLSALVAEWEQLHLARRSARYAAETPQAIRTSLPNLWERPAEQITRADAVNAIDQMVLAGKPGAARNVLTYARACFNWALRRGKVVANPFAGLPVVVPASERERVLSDDEVREIWATAGGLGYPFGPFFKMALLTLQRRDEVAGMRWSELDTDMTLWTLPGVRMKNGRPHDVHLSEPARTVLQAIPRTKDCDFVFSTTGRTAISGYSKAKHALDAAIVKARAKAAAEAGHDAAPLEPWWLHDFRRTGVTRLAAMGFDSIIVDKLLAHQPGKLRGVAGIYQRHDFARERAQALDAWGAHVVGLDGGGKVVKMPRRARR